MKNIDFKKIVPHIIAIVIFLAFSIGFASPELQGEKLKKADIKNHLGISKELSDYREANDGEQSLWTNSLFGGMPAYLVSVIYTNPVAKTFEKALTLGMKGAKKHLFLLMIGFYILMMVLKIDPWLAIVGSVAFAFSSYHVIILPAGHMAKIRVLGFIPIIMSGFILLFRDRKMILGTAVSALSIAAALNANHPQMLYYVFMVIMVFGLVLLADAVRNKTIPVFLKSSGLFVLALVLALGTSASRLMTINEYSKSSIRGQSDLIPESDDSDNKTSGLDRDYITSWSYGKAETFTLLVPNFNGGSSGRMGSHPEIIQSVMVKQPKQLKDFVGNSVNSYWGDQSYVAGPVYAGAGIILLAILGLWLIKGPFRWAILISVILMTLLAWGKNFAFLSDLFIDYFPAYNKFRAVSSMLTSVLFLLPLAAMMGMNRLIKDKEYVKSNMKQFYIAVGSVFGLVLLMLIAPTLFTSFFATGEFENFYQFFESQKLPSGTIDEMMTAISDVRQSLYSADVMRSLIIISLVIVALWLYLKDILKKELMLGALMIITVADLWTVDKRYMNEDSFQSAKRAERPFVLSPDEKQITQDKELGFRVYNQSASLDSDARTSYFHRSLGGYHGAKMGRYQEFLSKHFSTQLNTRLLDMLNTKYLLQGQEPKIKVQKRFSNLGTSWFVQDFKIVENANEELDAVGDFDPKTTAIIDKNFASTINQVAGSGTIEMTSYEPNHLTYQSNAASEGFAVFSEIYYQPGWNAYVDGQLSDHVRVNYILRGMNIPSGDHKIEFKFEPTSFSTGNTIGMVSNGFLVLLILGAIYLTVKGKDAMQVAEEPSED